MLFRSQIRTAKRAKHTVEVYVLFANGAGFKPVRSFAAIFTENRAVRDFISAMLTIQFSTSVYKFFSYSKHVLGQ